MQTERLSYIILLAYIAEWEDEQARVAAIDLAIEQRHGDMTVIFSRPKPPFMPAADWQRMQEITGVTQFQSTR